jgi:deoxyribodipyrimidine photo-lyase
MPDSVIHWFRRDLRLEDNTALDAALQSGAAVIPLFILDDRILTQPTMGAGRLRFLRTALRDLDAALLGHNSRLVVVRTDDAPRELNRIAQEVGAWSVYLNRDYTPYAVQRDTRATRGLQLTGILTLPFSDQLLVEPQEAWDEEGQPARDFDVFKQRWLAALDVAPEAAPVASGHFQVDADVPAGLSGWEGPWADEVSTDSDWPGATRESALSRLHEFVAQHVVQYEEAPDEHSSQLAGAFKFGTLSIREVVRTVIASAATNPRAQSGADAFLRALCLRDYRFHLLFSRIAGGGYPDDWEGTFALP